MGAATGAFLVIKVFLIKEKHSLEKNEIELKGIDLLGILTLNKMPFLRKPLTKAKNAIVVLACIVGTGGAGLPWASLKLLHVLHSERLNLELIVSYSLLWCACLFTFGVIVYQWTYLSEWRS